VSENRNAVIAGRHRLAYALRRKWVRTLWLSLVMALVSLACGRSAGPPSSQISHTQEASPQSPQPGPTEYTTSDFKPRLSLTMRENWGIDDQKGCLWLNAGNPPSILFVRIDHVATPKDYRIIPVPKNFIVWIQKHPNLSAGTPVPVTVGGVPGRQIDVEVRSAPPLFRFHSSPNDLLLFGCGNGDAVFAVGSRIRFIVLDVAGQRVTIEIDAPAEEFPDFLARADAVLETISFE
jgi:hypothetical protein